MKTAFFLLFALPYFWIVNITNAGANDIIGEWWIEDNSARVEIYKCDSEYCGKVTWLEYPNDKEGKPRVDKHNSDEKLRNRPLVGIDLFEGFHYQEGEWVDGKIYNPQNGKYYSCVLRLEKGQLTVRGYIGFTWIGKSTVWKRVEPQSSVVKGN